MSLPCYLSRLLDSHSRLDEKSCDDSNRDSTDEGQTGKKKKKKSNSLTENGSEGLRANSGLDLGLRLESVCLYPFTSSSSPMQRKIKHQYDELVKCHESEKLTLPQMHATQKNALRGKQARLEGLEDGFLSSNEESDWSDSLSDLNDVNMEDAYEDVGLPSGIFLEEHQSSAMAISDAGKYHGCVNKRGEHISQFVNLDDNSAKKPLEVNAEIELQQKEDSPVQSLCCERDKHSDDPGLDHIYHHFVQHTSNVSSLNQQKIFWQVTWFQTDLKADG